MLSRVEERRGTWHYVREHSSVSGNMAGRWNTAPCAPPPPGDVKAACRTLVEPLVDSVVRVLRMTDAITDMLLVRLMLDLVRPPPRCPQRLPPRRLAAVLRCTPAARPARHAAS